MKLSVALMATLGCISMTKANDCNADWADSFGNNCQKWADKGWCSPTGGYGIEWNAGWGKIENYAKDGQDAFVCPQCGCGKEKTGWEAEERWVEDVGQCADVNGKTIGTTFNYRITDLVQGQRPEATAGNRQECFAKCDAMNKVVPLQGCTWNPWGVQKNCIMYTVDAYKGRIAKGSGSTANEYGSVNYYCYFRKAVLENNNRGCWGECNGKQGPCLFCGAYGMCCTRKAGWTDFSNGCENTFGGKYNHACGLPDDYEIECSDVGQGQPVAQRLELIVKCYKAEMQTLKQELAG